jgi:hypothetical protein
MLVPRNYVSFREQIRAIRIQRLVDAHDPYRALLVLVDDLGGCERSARSLFDG